METLVMYELKRNHAAAEVDRNKRAHWIWGLIVVLNVVVPAVIVVVTDEPWWLAACLLLPLTGFSWIVESDSLHCSRQELNRAELNLARARAAWQQQLLEGDTQ